jgi:hypothetical protein
VSTREYNVRYDQKTAGCQLPTNVLLATFDRRGIPVTLARLAVARRALLRRTWQQESLLSILSVQPA